MTNWPIRKARRLARRTIDAGRANRNQAAIRRRTRAGTRKLNIGGGKWTHPGWEVLDYYVKAEHNLDLRMKPVFPLPDNSCSVIFTSHTLEHMDDGAVRHVLAEARRVLAPGGTLRVAVPDGEAALAAFNAGNRAFFTDGGIDCVGPTIESDLATIFASYRHGDHRGGPIVAPEDLRCVAAQGLHVLGPWCISQIPEEAGYIAHVNWFDEDKLLGLMLDAGFADVERSTFQGSSLQELRGPTFDNRPVVTLFVEGHATRVGGGFAAAEHTRSTSRRRLASGNRRRD